MNLTTKIAPKGIDIVVDEIQAHLNTELSTWTNFNCYPRAYKEETKNGVIPMINEDGSEYTDVFFNDGVDGSCFFYVEDSRSAVHGYFNDVTLSIVFQVQLDELYSTVHRADEEANNEVIIALKKLTDYEIVSLVTGLKNVYSEFDTSSVEFDDVGNFHVFRVDLKVIVNNNC